MRQSYRYRLNIDQYRLLAKYIESSLSERASGINSAGNKIFQTSDACIFEIGSRDAADAFVLSCFLGHDYQIIAFDPHNKFIELALPFSHLNPKLLLENIAIAGNTGSAMFYATYTNDTLEKCDDMGIGASSIKEPILNVPGLPTQGFRKFLVPCMTGEDYCAKNNKRPKVLILDVQWAEIEVLKSFGNYLGDVNLIFTEFNIDSERLYRSDSYARTLLKFLRERSFVPVKFYNISQYAADGIFVNLNEVSRSKGLTYQMTLKLRFRYSMSKLLVLSKFKRVYFFLNNLVRRWLISAMPH